MNIEQIEASARAELDAARDAKVQSIRELAEASQKVTDLRTELADAERAQARSYQNALRADWDDKTIKKLGITVPEKRGGGRPRATGRPADEPAEASTEND